MNGEAGSVQIHDASIQEHLRKFRDNIQHYELMYIYNMDETGLFYQSTPYKTISGNLISGIKLNKFSPTVCFFYNVDGFSKLPPIIIGKSEKLIVLKREVVIYQCAHIDIL